MLVRDEVAQLHRDACSNMLTERESHDFVNNLAHRIQMLQQASPAHRWP